MAFCATNKGETLKITLLNLYYLAYIKYVMLPVDCSGQLAFSAKALLILCWKTLFVIAYLHILSFHIDNPVSVLVGSLTGMPS